MTTPKKIPGMVVDPWRSAAQPQQPSTLDRMRAPLAPAVLSTDEIEEDLQDQKYATIELKGYGGITVDGTNELQIAAVRILEFCVEFQAKLEPYFTEYGVVIAKLEPVKPGGPLKFYIQRRDGWIVAIPNARTRDDGCLQLIQAMLKVQAQPALKALLTEYKIRPFRR